MGEASSNFTAVAFTVFMGLLVMILPRRWAAVPFVVGAIFIPMGLPVEIASITFFPFRILIVFGWLRLLARGELRIGKFQRIDKWLLLWITATVITYILLWETTAAAINAFGVAFNAIGAYFFFRCSVRDSDDLKRMVRVLSGIALCVAAAVLIERITTHNLFFVLGGVNEITEVREGSLRCQGPFAHSILAGTFGATLPPLLLILWSERRGAKWVLLGLAASVTIVANSISSGPVMTLLAAFLAVMAWPLRSYMRLIRWITLVTLIALHLVMNAPVWALITRASVFGSSSSDHRYRLLNSFITHVGDWWLVGTQSYSSWGWNMHDVSNNYVRVGVDGGIITLGLFFALIVSCFSSLGRRLHAVKSFKERKLLWYLGASLFSHLVAFVGATYWDQIIVVWYLLLALIARATTPLRPVVENLQPVEMEPVSVR